MFPGRPRAARNVTYGSISSTARDRAAATSAPASICREAVCTTALTRSAVSAGSVTPSSSSAATNGALSWWCSSALASFSFSLGAAESCTGGLVGSRLTDIPGSSDVFIGAVVCYADRLKIELLEVPPALIETHGAVSEEVARAMAEGALRRLQVDLAVAVTGIAGPGGGTPDKPVGTVWLAVSSAARTEARHIVFLGSRREIRERAAQTALYLLDRRLLAD